MMTIPQVALYIAIMVLGMVAFGWPFCEFVLVMTLIVIGIFAVLFWQRRTEWQELPEDVRSARENRTEYWLAMTGRFPSNNIVWCGWIAAAMLSSIIAVTHPGPSAIDYLTAPQSSRAREITQQTDREIAALWHLAKTGSFSGGESVTTEDEAKEAGDWRRWPMSLYMWFMALVLLVPTIWDELREAGRSAVDHTYRHFGGNVTITGPGAGFATSLLNAAARRAGTTLTLPTTPPTPAPAPVLGAPPSTGSSIDRAVASITSSTFLQHVLASLIPELLDRVSWGRILHRRTA
ncbi:MAG: hypothetical protein WC817_00545 [Patescibacteria group bacterium]|jgi:hypothetical protein